MIPKYELSPRQVDQIINHIEESGRLICHRGGWDNNECGRWDIDTEDEYVRGSTFMDNFDMHQFLIAIGVPQGVVDWA